VRDELHSRYTLSNCRFLRLSLFLWSRYVVFLRTSNERESSRIKRQPQNPDMDILSGLNQKEMDISQKVRHFLVACPALPQLYLMTSVVLIARLRIWPLVDLMYSNIYI
jgi:hypothetical protein